MQVMIQRKAAAPFLIVGFLFGPVEHPSAAQLNVNPILLELNAPAAAGILTLRNDDDVEVAVQTRVYRWSQLDGKDSLTETSDVVASPPTVKLAPRADYTVRVVRVAKQPVGGEENYRVIVDQLPNLRSQQLAGVNVLIRQSIPVFFRARQFTVPTVTWSLVYEGNNLVVVAANGGDEHMRIATLRLRDVAGTTISFGEGLVGYALGRSSMRWPAPTKAPRGFGGLVSISAETNKGPTRATAQLRDRR